MTVKKLKEIIKDIPDKAEVIIYADHGHHYECAFDTFITRDNLEECYDLESIRFEYNDFTEGFYDDLSDYPFDGEITGIVIFGI